MDWNITSRNENQFGSSRCSDNRDPNYWTVFYKMKVFDCSSGKKLPNITDV